MANEKVFDRADLLRIFQDVGIDATVGKFTVIAPSPTLFGETTTENKRVEASTQAYWCERYALSVVVQSIDFPEGGANLFDKTHPLRAGRKVTVKYGGGNSARLMRWILSLADEWREDVAAMLPTEPIDLRNPSPSNGVTATVYINDEPIGQIDLSVPAPDEIDDDHTPTGITVDNPFEDETDDD